MVVLANATKPRRLAVSATILAVIQLLALLILVGSEEKQIERVAFLLFWGSLNFLFWGSLNFLWMVALRRPTPADALSLGMIVVLVLLSQFNHDVFNLTVTFMCGGLFYSCNAGIEARRFAF
jgi:hypothetical protein